MEQKIYKKVITSLICFQDRYADAKSLPPKDKKQNYILTGFKESGRKTVLRFNRKFDTCDPRDRKIKVTIAFIRSDLLNVNSFQCF